MKKFILSVLMLGAVSAPLMAEQKLEKPKMVRKSANFYVSNSLSLSVTPGLRMQYDRFGLDVGATLGATGVLNATAAGILYLNPYSSSKWQHNLSLGGIYLPGVSVETTTDKGDYFSVEVDSGVRALGSYGFQRQLKGDSYWFMNFGLVGPVEIKGEVDGDRFNFAIPLPLINIGYAF